MQNLLNFLARYYFVWLFLLLVTLALVLLYHNHHYHRSFFIHSANRISGGVYGLQDRVTGYFSLSRANEMLAEQNRRLLQQMPASFIETDTKRFIVNDTLYSRRYEYLNARVINNSVTRRNNYLTLNKGRKHGIEPDMGVITANGVVGIVKDASANFSSVISLLHQDMQISVRHKATGHIGSLNWEGGDYRLAQMSYIPSHVELAKGDTIITSGYSRMFPPGILIGTIVGYEMRRGENFFTAEIQLAQDFNMLSHVHVINDLLGTEQKELEYLNEL